MAHALGCSCRCGVTAQEVRVDRAWHPLTHGTLGSAGLRNSRAADNAARRTTWDTPPRMWDTHMVRWTGKTTWDAHRLAGGASRPGLGNTRGAVSRVDDLGAASGGSPSVVTPCPEAANRHTPDGPAGRTALPTADQCHGLAGCCTYLPRREAATTLPLALIRHGCSTWNKHRTQSDTAQDSAGSNDRLETRLKPPLSSVARVPRRLRSPSGRLMSWRGGAPQAPCFAGPMRRPDRGAPTSSVAPPPNAAIVRSSPAE